MYKQSAHLPLSVCRKGNVWAAICTCLLLVGCNGDLSRQPSFDLSQASYVGREKCIECHREQADAFAGSHHDLAMQPANETTVLGDFRDASLEHLGIVSRMFRKDGKYMVQTEGPDGQLQDFEVKYVFGVEPLQQYMVEFPSSDQLDAATEKQNDAKTSPIYPRIQVLGVCWDTRAKRWFYLAPPDVKDKLDPDDELHWTGIAQRWNTMCADCHSTSYVKNFQPPTHPLVRNANVRSETQGAHVSKGATVDFGGNREIAGEYHSTFFEIDVSCEACHGPGSVHVELAGKWAPGWNRQRGFGLANLKASAENQIQACAPCHSRRRVVQGGFKAGDNFYDHFTNALLTEPVYYADGQIWDEDYVHGSFIQSKMYHKGIQCSDCHDPHSARLKHDGNAVCTSCHQHPAAKYDSVAHHFHPSDGKLEDGRNGTLCVNCHMPSTTYMQVDARRDHSLRIPRPDLSLSIGTPNACTGCHLKLENVAAEKRPQLELYQHWLAMARTGDEEVLAELKRVDEWCNDACDRWYGAARLLPEHFGEALAAAQNGSDLASEKLVGLLNKRGAEAPALARATALQLLMNVDTEAAAEEAIQAIEDEHPLVRHAAAAALLSAAGKPQTIPVLVKALSDPIRSVRIQAVRSLLQLAPEQSLTNAGPALRSALAELEAGVELNNDYAGAHLDLGVLAERRGLQQQAIKHYEMAIAVEPRVVGPRANLADLLERIGQANANADAMKETIERLRQEELPLVERNARLLPDVAELQYRYCLALYLNGQLEKAALFAVKAAELDDREVEFAQMAAMLFESLKQYEKAVTWAEEAVKRSGSAAESIALLKRIQDGASK